MDLPTIEEVIRNVSYYQSFNEKLNKLIYDANVRINDDNIKYLNESNMDRFERMKNSNEWYEFNNDRCNSLYCNNELPSKYYRLKGTYIIFCEICIKNDNIDKNKDNCIKLIDKDIEDSEYFDRLSKTY